MNSAPAELLHPLIDAALQPSSSGFFQRKLRASDVKNAGNMPALESHCKTLIRFFKEKTALPEKIGQSGIEK